MNLGLKESREGLCWRERGRSFHVDGPKTEKAREPTVESLYEECGGKDYQKQSGECEGREGGGGEGVTAEDSYRD